MMSAPYMITCAPGHRPPGMPGVVGAMRTYGVPEEVPADNSKAFTGSAPG